MRYPRLIQPLGRAHEGRDAEGKAPFSKQYGLQSENPFEKPVQRGRSKVELGPDGRRFAGWDEKGPYPSDREDTGREKEINVARTTYEESRISDQLREIRDRIAPEEVGGDVLLAGKSPEGRRRQVDDRPRSRDTGDLPGSLVVVRDVGEDVAAGDSAEDTAAERKPLGRSEDETEEAPAPAEPKGFEREIETHAPHGAFRGRHVDQICAGSATDVQEARSRIEGEERGGHAPGDPPHPPVPPVPLLDTEHRLVLGGIHRRPVPIMPPP